MKLEIIKEIKDKKDRWGEYWYMVYRDGSVEKAFHNENEALEHIEILKDRHLNPIPKEVVYSIEI